MSFQGAWPGVDLAADATAIDPAFVAFAHRRFRCGGGLQPGTRSDGCECDWCCFGKGEKSPTFVSRSSHWTTMGLEKIHIIWTDLCNRTLRPLIRSWLVYSSPSRNAFSCPMNDDDKSSMEPDDDWRRRRARKGDSLRLLLLSPVACCSQWCIECCES